MRQSLTIQPVQCWIGSKLSDACCETPHKACSHSLFVPEISEMINSCSIPLEMDVKLQHPYSIPHAKIHRQPWPFCASAENGTLSSSVSRLKDQCDFIQGGKKRIQQTPSLLAMWACVSVWALWKWNWKSPKKKEKWWRVKEKWSQTRIKQGWNKTRTNGEQIRVEHQMVKKNKRHSPCKNQEEKGFHSLLSTAHSRGGKAVYSFSNASVSVDVCVWVYWAKNRVVIEK